jgi:hypothetical protein
LVVMCVVIMLFVLTLAACQPVFQGYPPQTPMSPTVMPKLPISIVTSGLLQVSGNDQQSTNKHIVYATDVDVQGNFDKDTFGALTQTYTETTRLESLLVCDSRTRTWTMYVNRFPADLTDVEQVSEHVAISTDENNNLFEIVNGRVFSISSTVAITSVIGTASPSDLATVVPQLASHFSQSTGLPVTSTNVMPKAATTAMLLLSTQATNEPSSPLEYTLVPFVNVDARCNEQAPGGIFDCVEWCSDCINCGWYCSLCSALQNQ